MKKHLLRISLIEFIVALVLSGIGIGCSREKVAPGAPGDSPVWAYAGKTGIGTSYETYQQGQYAPGGPTGTISKVWFSLAKGMLTETMYGLIHESQIKELKFIVVGDNFIDFEENATISTVDYLHKDEAGRPISLAYKIVNRDKDGLYEIEKHIFTNPDDQALYLRVIFKSKAKNIRPFLYLNPHINNTGINDRARVDRKAMHAFEDNTHLTLLSSRNFEKVSAGFVGTSDGLIELAEHKELRTLYNSTGKTSGNVAMIGQLGKMGEEETQTYDFVIGFGPDAKASRQAAAATMKTGYKKVLANYNGEGEYVGWEDYLASLDELNTLAQSTADGGKLLNVSAMVLKAQEDKTHAGALIASLSNPWGETAPAEQPATGYKAVWPRDFYQCAMAFLAMGDEQTPLVAFEYLKKVQVHENTPGNKGVTGWFLQKTHVDGEIEWISIQLDQTAMPIVLGWKLWKAGIIDNENITKWYHTMLKPAADFLIHGGTVDLDWNKIEVKPPLTQQERWEEQWGYSPSTVAAVIAGLVSAADLAELAGDTENAKAYLAAADRYEANIEATMFTTNGHFNKGQANGKYFIRITQNEYPNDGAPININNGKPGLNESMILDGGFLELVRYGVRKATDQSILESLPELDNQDIDENLKVKYLFTFNGDEAAYPGWRRYGNDGYGESILDGSNYGIQTDDHRGRVWPIFTGERGHYELARAIDEDRFEKSELVKVFVKGMEYFANQGYMLPEQVWDGVGVNIAGYETGEGTNAATPLAWSHAEYVKLLRSINDQKVWDIHPLVKARYAQ